MNTASEMPEFWKFAIGRQFHAAIDMLGNAISACPDSVWAASGDRPFWYVAFHVVFFLDMYLSAEDESRFQPPPPFGRGELEDRVVLPERVYTKDELRDYLRYCREKLDGVMAAMKQDWATGPCPFPYRNMCNGELLLYNMRHVQHHAAQLNLLLRQTTHSAPDWVSKGGRNNKV
jgi:uncharacterized damage-inducible protein DinB